MSYLDAEQLIIDQLKLRVPDVRAVFSTAELVGVEEAAQVTPALHVIYDGDRLAGSAGRGAAQTVYQQWIVVVAVRSARDQRGGSGARYNAGPIINDALAALSGWQPSNLHGPLQRVQAPLPGYSQGGFGYFPLAFESAIVTGGGN